MKIIEIVNENQEELIITVGTDLYDPSNPNRTAKIIRVDTINSDVALDPEIQLNDKQNFRYKKVFTLSTSTNETLYYVKYGPTKNDNKSIQISNNPRNTEHQQNRFPINIDPRKRNNSNPNAFWQIKSSLNPQRDYIKPSNFSPLYNADRKTNEAEKDLNLWQELHSQNGFIRLGTIKNMILQTPKIGDFSEYSPEKLSGLANLLDRYVSGNRVNFPYWLIPDINEFEQSTGIKDIKKISTDFMEIIAPIAVISNNVNGNARLMLEKILKTSYSDLREKAYIKFSDSGSSASNTELYDSIVAVRDSDGRTNQILISSKEGVGHSVQLSSLRKSISECRKIFGDEKFDQAISALIKDQNYQNAWRIIEYFSSENLERPKWETSINIAVDLQIIEPSDKQFLLELRNAISRIINKKYNMGQKSNNELSKEKLNIIVSQAEKNISNQFSISEKFKTILNQKLANSINYGTRKYLASITKSIEKKINQNNAFSNLASWLLNHAAVIQVYSFTERKQQGLVLTNLVGIWPSQTVDSVFLKEDDAVGIGFKLQINKQIENRTSQEIPTMRDQQTSSDLNIALGPRDKHSAITKSKDWKKIGKNINN